MYDSASPPVPPPRSKRQQKLKTVLTKQFYLWHWTSSAVCLAAMLLFAVTGITLNNSTVFNVTPKVSEAHAVVPESLRSLIQPNEADADESLAPLPRRLAQWLSRETSESLFQRKAEWSADEIYISLPRPGGDAWITIDRASGDVHYEKTTRGLISYLNDLHKGRHTGPVWKWFLDIFSVACVVFSLTGLGLLYVHSKRRPSTWPFVISGILLPIIIIVFFIH